MAAPEDFLEHLGPLIDDDGLVQPPLMDVEGYYESVERCRRLFPDLRILTGVEFGQPHLDSQAAAAVLDLSALDRVNGSLHTLPFRGHRSEPPTLFRELSEPAEVIWTYLAEALRMVDGGGNFEVFTHIDYAVRYWPTEKHGPFDPRPFEDGFRQAMRAIAASGRALEMNTGRPLRPWIPQWWADEGGRAVSFGSDDHNTHMDWPPTSPRRLPCWNISASAPVDALKTSGPAKTLESRRRGRPSAGGVA